MIFVDIDVVVTESSREAPSQSEIRQTKIVVGIAKEMYVKSSDLHSFQ